MSEVSEIANMARNIESAAITLERNINQLVERNSNLFKALATIKTSLERALKQPSNLNQAIYDSINLARTLTPYTEASTGKVKIDPPLTEEEKTLN